MSINLEANKTMLEHLNKFYEQHYKIFLRDKISRLRIRPILDAQLDQYFTNLNNNIQAHYWMRLREALNFIYNVKNRKLEIDKKDNTDESKRNEKRNITLHINNVQIALLNNTFDLNNTEWKYLVDLLKMPVYEEFKIRDISEKKYYHDLREYNKFNPKSYLNIIESINNIKIDINDVTGKEITNPTEKGRITTMRKKEEKIKKLREKLAGKEHLLNMKKIEINSKYKPSDFNPDLSIYNYEYQFSNNPTLYLQSFFTINNLLGEKGLGKFHTVPLCKSGIPSYITLTKSSLSNLFSSITLDESSDNINEGDENNEDEEDVKDEKEDDSDVKKNYNVWKKYFHIFKDDDVSNRNDTMLRNEFKKKDYHFHYISTNGVGVTILFRSNRFLKKGYKANKTLNNKLGKISNVSSKTDVPYLSDVVDSQKYIEHKIVAIDPNKIDVLYCTNGEYIVNNETGKAKSNVFRYTKPQIDHESKRKRYEEIMNTARQKSGIQEIESSLSQTNPKSTNYEIFKCYLLEKVNTFSEKLLEHYRYDKKPNVKSSDDKASYRRLRMYSKINLERSEANMLNKFEEKFGKPEKIIVCIGNYSQTHLRGTAPVKGKGYRKLFKDQGYNVFLIDEFRTSSLCHLCHNKLNMFHRKCDRKCKKSVEKKEPNDETKRYIRVVLGCLSTRQ